ncbi:phosphate/phosphite/phosphonate ABC transporter substrate-binding protein [Ruegeria sp. 2012CJ41-6]|uniref:Phosphate/phosphite/phosphonate ABC transporter substrate-binding protein n=1 Tax=Ruegeria spongiae TaxID=2942209 RepID=A0ABT0PXR1_9RHOB|nr:PhnD/SsuA/transferrin family substrate-binding protein [Ruegeria spongiae]MCL6282375.1 phosphate/phosphite/phosphonate ABC transporter substrate-binding protein [Ruegeria spongiae]
MTRQEPDAAMIASLMMYRRPELDDAIARYWGLIRANLALSGVAAPKVLSQEVEEFAVWNDPDLVLSQTCGMPYRLWLHDKVELVGTPDFGVKDCPPGYYRSVLVVRADDTRSNLEAFEGARFAYNEVFSQSGYAAPYAHVMARGFWFEHRLRTHGHLNSARSVAEGKTDIAALDAVSWRLIRAYEPFAKQLRVLDLTEPTPGLPLIAAKGQPAELIFGAVATAIAQLSETDRQLLGLKGITRIPRAAYLSIPNPPDPDSD